ncbi:MAG: glycosyl hydrolase family 17 protein [Candidatus Korobacteraceae bacterium]
MSIYGVAFEPYVGPWVGDGPVLYNVYTLAQVQQLLKPVAEHFSLITTYGQGTFVWQGKPIVQDGNRLNIQAASTAGLKVSAGCYQQGADSNNDSINVEWTKTEIDYAIQQAKTYNNVVDLVIGNECIWGPNSTQAIIDLIGYAKSKRAPLTAATLPITTRQQWGVLGGVDNTSPNYASMRQKLLALMAACENHVYGNMYAYFDKDIANQIGQNPTQASFAQAVKASMTNQLSGLKTAFSNQNIGLEIRIGETGWPTQGSQKDQPNPSLANVTYAQWYYAAMVDWANSNGVKTVPFAAYDEPWKGPADGSDSEAFFGIWKADGSASDRGHYTLNGVTPKYTLG